MFSSRMTIGSLQDQLTYPKPFAQDYPKPFAKDQPLLKNGTTLRQAGASWENRKGRNDGDHWILNYGILNLSYHYFST